MVFALRFYFHLSLSVSHNLLKILWYLMFPLWPVECEYCKLFLAVSTKECDVVRSANYWTLPVLIKKRPTERQQKKKKSFSISSHTKIHPLCRRPASCRATTPHIVAVNPQKPTKLGSAIVGPERKWLWVVSFRRQLHNSFCFVVFSGEKFVLRN
jgi:hypothetical protein